MNESDRSFTVVEMRKSSQKNKSGSLKKTSGVGGRYVSKDPKSAALKAFNAACAKKAIRNQCSLDVTIQETSSGSLGKIYKYKCKREKLNPPKKIMRGDTEITFNYTSTATSLN